jgi:rubrerythrin
MTFWEWLTRRAARSAAAPRPRPTRTGPIALPTEPFVFECRQCGKVFEARRRKAPCPECDSFEVEIVSE